MKTKFWFFLIFSVVLFSSSCSISIDNTHKVNEIPNSQEESIKTVSQENITEKINEEVSQYFDEELWIKFSYPNKWWNLKKEYDVPGEKWVDFATLSDSEWNLIFSFANWNPSAWRWWFWWDDARKIMSNESIKDLCTWNQDIILDTENLESCEVKINKNWIHYVKLVQKYDVEKMMNWEKPEKLVTFYYFYNEKSPFYWIVVSDERLDSSWKNINILENMIETLSFE